MNRIIRVKHRKGNWPEINLSGETGTWIEKDTGKKYPERVFSCSRCKAEISGVFRYYDPVEKQEHFCFNCGARMGV